MRARIVVIGFAMALLSACVPPPRQGAPMPPTANAEPESQTAAAPAELTEPEMKTLAPVDVRVMKCSTLNSASDDDKAYASTFLLGYRAGLMRSHILDTKKIDAVEQAAVAECANKPDALASRVFAAAQLKIEASNAPPHRLHRRPLQATPAVASPQAAPEPTPSTGTSQEAPLRYAPAQGASPPEAKETTPSEPPSPAQPAPPEPPAGAPPASEGPSRQ